MDLRISRRLEDPFGHGTHAADDPDWHRLLGSSDAEVAALQATVKVTGSTEGDSFEIRRGGFASRSLGGVGVTCCSRLVLFQ